MKDELTALAERVQALPAKGCRLTEIEVARLVLGRAIGVPKYTISLDAAMTLAKTDAEACAVLHEAMDALSRDCPTQGNWRAHLPRYVVAEFIRVRLAQVQP